MVSVDVLRGGGSRGTRSLIWIGPRRTLLRLVRGRGRGGGGLGMAVGVVLYHSGVTQLLKLFDLHSPSVW